MTLPFQHLRNRALRCHRHSSNPLSFVPKHSAEAGDGEKKLIPSAFAVFDQDQYLP